LLDMVCRNEYPNGKSQYWHGPNQSEGHLCIPNSPTRGEGSHARKRTLVGHDARPSRGAVKRPSRAEYQRYLHKRTRRHRQ
jgi:hypothetical protein